MAPQLHAPAARAAAVRALSAWAAVPCIEGLSLSMLAETPAFEPLLRAIASAGRGGEPIIDGTRSSGLSSVGSCSAAEHASARANGPTDARECLLACELLEACVEAELHDGQGKHQCLPPAVSQRFLEAVLAGLRPVFVQAERRAAIEAAHAPAQAPTTMGASRGAKAHESENDEEVGNDDDDANENGLGAARLALLRASATFIRDGATSLLGAEATSVVAFGGIPPVVTDRERRPPPPPPPPPLAAAAMQNHGKGRPPPPPPPPLPSSSPFAQSDIHNEDDPVASSEAIITAWHLSRQLMSQLILCVRSGPTVVVESILQSDPFAPPLAAAAAAWPPHEMRGLVQQLAEALCKRARMPANDGHLEESAASSSNKAVSGEEQLPSSVRMRLALREHYLGVALSALAEHDIRALPMHALNLLRAAVRPLSTSVGKSASQPPSWQELEVSLWSVAATADVTLAAAAQESFERSGSGMGAIETPPGLGGVGFAGPIDELCGAILECAVNDMFTCNLNAATQNLSTGMSLLLATRCNLIGCFVSWIHRHATIRTGPLVAPIMRSIWHPHAFTTGAAVSALSALAHQVPERLAMDEEALRMTLECTRNLPDLIAADKRLSILHAAARIVASSPTAGALEALLGPIATQFVDRVVELETTCRPLAEAGAQIATPIAGRCSPTNLSTTPIDGERVRNQRAALIETSALLSAVIRPFRARSASAPKLHPAVAMGMSSAGFATGGGLPLEFLHQLWPIWLRAFRLASFMAEIDAGSNLRSVGGGAHGAHLASCEGVLGASGSGGVEERDSSACTSWGLGGEADELVGAVASIAAACSWSCTIDDTVSSETAQPQLLETSAFVPFVEPTAMEAVATMQRAGAVCGGLADPYARPPPLSRISSKMCLAAVSTVMLRFGVAPAQVQSRGGCTVRDALLTARSYDLFNCRRSRMVLPCVSLTSTLLASTPGPAALRMAAAFGALLDAAFTVAEPWLDEGETSELAAAVLALGARTCKLCPPALRHVPHLLQLLESAARLLNSSRTPHSATSAARCAPTLSSGNPSARGEFSLAP